MKNAELFLTYYFASQLDLEVDVDVFRGFFPENIDEGVAVIINNEVVDNQYRQPTYNIQLLGKFLKRDSALNFLSKVHKLVPTYKTIFDDAIIHSIRARGTSEPYIADDDGNNKYFATFNMIAVIETINNNQGE